MREIQRKSAINVFSIATLSPFVEFFLTIRCGKTRYKVEIASIPQPHPFITVKCKTKTDYTSSLSEINRCIRKAAACPSYVCLQKHLNRSFAFRRSGGGVGGGEEVIFARQGY